MTSNLSTSCPITPEYYMNPIVISSNFQVPVSNRTLWSAGLELQPPIYYICSGSLDRHSLSSLPSLLTPSPTPSRPTSLNTTTRGHSTREWPDMIQLSTSYGYAKPENLRRQVPTDHSEARSRTIAERIKAQTLDGVARPSDLEGLKHAVSLSTYWIYFWL